MLLIIYYSVYVITFAIYSYTQIDLNLTISANTLYQRIQQGLIQVGYFQRPLSSAFFLIILFLSYTGYCLLLCAAFKHKISGKNLAILVIISSFLVFAYPAFSHDLFNYIFDGRIVIHYGLSPSFFKALDFPDDTWVRFMHWTHRYYPYGPFWLWLTLIPSYIGLNKFVWTLTLFKLTFLAFHLCNIWLILKIARIINSRHHYANVIFYAFNPLILIESLISPHNEVVMLTFTLLGLYFLLRNRIVLFVLAIILSVGIKYISFIILPWSWIVNRSSKYYLTSLWWLWMLCLIPLYLSREPYSWYFIPIIGLCAISTRFKWLALITISLSLGLLIRYFPILLFGEYSAVTRYYQEISFLGATLVIGLILFIGKKQYLSWEN